ncbi:RNA polymerase sigma factor [Actinoplanes sp. NPDC051633]|uniref:RNA polymerase sigma factor n=1 Tax=Actinoplanes sp. NPDC051633 TaxID=3155670 RepID=UPI0034323FCF
MVYDDDRGLPLHQEFQEPVAPEQRRNQRSKPAVGEVRDAQFRTFYLSTTPRLVRFLLWQGADLNTAADVAQETMRRAHRDWLYLSDPAAWVRVVAARELIRLQLKSERETLFAEVPESTVLPPDITCLSDEREAVLGLLRRLPPRQRQVMAWTIDGYGPQEIAKILDITEEATRSNLYKARSALTSFLRVQREEEDRVQPK